MNTSRADAANTFEDARRPLVVDVEQDLAATGERLLHGVKAGAVAAAMDPVPLRKGALLDHFIERGVTDEVVVDAVALTAAWRAGGVRHREL